MNPSLERSVPAGLPGFLVPLHLRLRGLVARLPVAPPSLLAARLLDRVLLPRLPQDARRLLEGHGVKAASALYAERGRALAREGYEPLLAWLKPKG